MIIGGIYRYVSATPPEPFITIWETTAAGEVLNFPAGPVGTFDYEIDWGDGTVENYNTSAHVSHTYAIAGEYTITVLGQFPSFRLADDITTRDKIREVVQLGITGWENLYAAFNGAFSMRSVNLGINDTSAVQDFSFMFSAGFKVTSMVGFETMDVSSATTLQQMFNSNGILTTPPDVSTWDTSNVTNMGSVFKNCDAFTTAPDCSGWDTSNTTIMAEMFYNCAGIGATVVDSIINFDTHNMFASDGEDMTRLIPNIPTAEYDKLLIAWGDGRAVGGSIRFYADGAKYTGGGAAEAGRNVLDNAPNNWFFFDGGVV